MKSRVAITNSALQSFFKTRVLDLAKWGTRYLIYLWRSQFHGRDFFDHGSHGPYIKNMSKNTKKYVIKIYHKLCM
jgi:hypothetical protein